MKAKKAIKRLTKVETLLTGVLSQYSAGEAEFHKLVESAKEAVARARDAVESNSSSAVAKKTAVVATASKSTRLSEAGRKSISRAAKKRWAAARRKGMNPVTGRRLGKTA